MFYPLIVVSRDVEIIAWPFTAIYAPNPIGRFGLYGHADIVSDDCIDSFNTHRMYHSYVVNTPKQVAYLLMVRKKISLVFLPTNWLKIKKYAPRSVFTILLLTVLPLRDDDDYSCPDLHPV